MEIKNELSIVLSGKAGQGLKTVEKMLTGILNFSGYHIYTIKEYMSRVRGGNNTTTIRISSERVTAFVDRIDLLVILNENAIHRLNNRISDDTIIIGSKSDIESDFDGDNQTIEIGFEEIATEVGKKIYSNLVAVGFLAGLLTVDMELVDKFIKKSFSEKGDDVVEKNKEAAEKGYEAAQKWTDEIKIDISKDEKVKDELTINGTQAVGMGALAGGCNFISSYPMSPSTGVLVFLSDHMEDFGIISEQAEDEIAAINMSIGAWYAGARAMVTTSGGGLALMNEGLSLAGILETPTVIHLAQRPGPATGLPTRTEQGDLNLAVYAGHGDFPRILLAPGTLEDAFYLTQKAFNLADKYQVPVIILTDQGFVDQFYNTPVFDLSDIENEKHFIKTEEGYKRYELSDDGISPRGIPGYGDGLVAVDSDEHNAEGHITEDLEWRIEITEKRMKKEDTLMESAIPPELIGSDNYKTLLIGWGSTYNVIKEAMETVGDESVGFLHFKQVYPIHPDTAKYLDMADSLITIENNMTGQFGKLITLNFGHEMDEAFLKYNGLPFSVEELVQKIETIL